MRYKQFGKTNIMISAIGFGTWGFDTRLWRDGKISEFGRCLEIAVELGVNFVDTALIYGDGQAEKIIGVSIKSTESRHCMNVATKVSPKIPISIPSPHIHADQAFPSAHIRESTEKSLKNLGTDCIFLQQLHAWSPRWLYEGEWLNTLQQLKKEGKIRAIGVSLHDHDCISAIDLITSGYVDSIQVQYNLFDQGLEKYIGDLATRHGVAVLGRSPLYAGALAGNYASSKKFIDDDWRSSFFEKQHLEEVNNRVSQMKKEFNLPHHLLADFALSFAVSNPFITSVLVGMRSTKNVYSTINCANKPYMYEDIRQYCRRYDWLS
ncbi:aldo/keto reductase [Rheinheimera fenheensis]|uniref:aldo/keto reductase n=1 Tax=Rheinheimera fenheensis TaxID=3152295 RepID=UPI0032600612